jgi:hypothetical protein
MFALQGLHPGQLIYADRAFPLLGSFSGLGIDLTALDNFLLPPFVGDLRQPIPEAVRSEQLAAPILPQIGGMPRGDLFHNASGFQFVGDFSSRPLTDRALELDWCWRRARAAI